MANIVFMGTPLYAVATMEALLDAGHEISLLLCRPDGRGRGGRAVKPPATKTFALDRRLKILQPADFRSSETIGCLREQNADFFVVVAYGNILPEAVLDIPKFGCINVHGSLLPKWRGAAPIQYALMAGERETGVCTMLMDEGMDTGDLLLSERIRIGKDTMINRLSEEMARLSAELAVRTIAQFSTIVPQKQDHKKATYSHPITAADRIVDWNRTAFAIYNRYRALSPQPGIHTIFRKKALLLKSIRLDPGIDSDDPPGTVVAVGNDAITVAAGEGGIKILTCQPESRKPISAADLVNGYRIKTGERLG